MLRNTNSFCRIKKDKRANNIFETFPPKIKVNVMHTGFENAGFSFAKGNCHLTVVEVREQQQMSGNASSESIFIGGET